MERNRMKPNETKRKAKQRGREYLSLSLPLFDSLHSFILLPRSKSQLKLPKAEPMKARPFVSCISRAWALKVKPTMTLMYVKSVFSRHLYYFLTSLSLSILRDEKFKSKICVSEFR